MTSFFLSRPWMLLLLIFPIIFIVVKLRKYNSSQHMMNSEIFNHFNNENTRNITRHFKYFAIPWIIGVLALSGPTIENREKPLYQNEEVWVWAMDLSNSMLADDIKPSRYMQMRYALLQLLSKTPPEKRIALVVFAGNAYTLIPPTNDFNTLKSYIRQLEPGQMPMQGSDPFLALKMSEELINEYGKRGNILLITDDMPQPDEAAVIADFINSSKNRYFLYVIGSETGAALKQKDGTLIKDHDGRVVIAKTNYKNIEALTKKSKVNIFYHENEYKLPSIYEHAVKTDPVAVKDTYEQFDFGYLMAIPLLLMATVFRKGFIFTLLTGCLLVLPSFTGGNAYATDKEGMEYFNDGQFMNAANAFENNRWKGNSYYRAGDYHNAIKFYEKSSESSTPLVIYNLANCYAMLGDLDTAVMLYGKVIATDNPYAYDATYNLNLIKQLQFEELTRQHAISAENINLISTADGGSNECSKEEGCRDLNPQDLIRNRLRNLQSKSSVKKGPLKQW